MALAIRGAGADHGPTLVTDRLILRPFDPADARRLAEVSGARRIADAMISVPHPMSLEIAREQIAAYEGEWRAGTAATFAIALKARAEQCIGLVAVRHIDREHAEGELSFWIAESEEGRGYVTEAASAALEYAFRMVRLNRVCAFHMVRNPASARVLAKIGMVQEGRLRERVRKRGVYEDVLLWAILRADWQARTATDRE